MRDGQSPSSEMFDQDQQRPEGWDAFKVLEIVNTEYSNKVTCPSQTTRKKRCTKTRDAATDMETTRILSRMSLSDPSKFLENRDELRKLAKGMLCSWHADTQVDYAVKKWQKLINDSIRERSDRRLAALAALAQSDGGRSRINGMPGGTANRSSTRRIKQERTSPESRFEAVDPADNDTEMSNPMLSVKQERVSPEPHVRATSGAYDDVHPSRAFRNHHQRGPRSSPVSVATCPPPRRTPEQPSMGSILRRLQELTLEVGQLKEDRAESRKKLKSLEDEKATLKKELKTANRRLKAVEEERDDLSAQVEEQYEEINELMEKLESVQDTSEFEDINA